MIGKVIKGLSLVTFQVLVVGTIRRNQAEESGRRDWGGKGSRRAQKWAAGGWSSKEGLSKHVKCPGCSAKVLGFSSVIATWDLDRTKQSPTGEGSTETTGKELG